MIKIKNILLLIFALYLSFSYSSNKTRIHLCCNDSVKSKFNFKTGIKESGIYFHYGKIDEFKHDRHSIKKGYYIFTECLLDLDQTKQEVIRYFNFGFPEADFLMQPNNHLFFLMVHFSETKQDAINKVIETKSLGVPHVWIQVIEE
jgi:hypothetical protein